MSTSTNVTSNIPGMPGQALIQLEITTLDWLVGLTIDGYVLHYLKLKEASVGTIWLCSVCMDWKTSHFMALITSI